MEFIGRISFYLKGIAFMMRDSRDWREERNESRTLSLSDSRLSRISRTPRSRPVHDGLR